MLQKLLAVQLLQTLNPESTEHGRLPPRGSSRAKRLGTSTAREASRPQRIFALDHELIVYCTSQGLLEFAETGVYRDQAHPEDPRIREPKRDSWFQEVPLPHVHDCQALRPLFLKWCLATEMQSLWQRAATHDRAASSTVCHNGTGCETLPTQTGPPFQHKIPAGLCKGWN